jgi:hypothetical protein
MLARICACALLLLLAACAAALPGYIPPPLKSKNKLASPFTSGDIGPDGLYHMSEQEKLMDCKRTAGSMLITISHLRHRAGEVATSQAALAANQVARPLLGGSPRGLDRDTEHARDFARLAAYNRHLASKGCPPVDIEAELAKAPEPMGKRY